MLSALTLFTGLYSRRKAAKRGKDEIVVLTLRSLAGPALRYFLAKIRLRKSVADMLWIESSRSIRSTA